MRPLLSTCLVPLAAFALGPVTASADHWPVVVVPGKPGVPVIVNGYDASFGVVEGDWGLYRPGQVAPTVIYAPRVIERQRTDHYFPRSGKAPRMGRYEIEPSPNRPLPAPAQSFHREWGVQSQPGPVTEYPPFDPPPVIVAPNVDRRGRPAPPRPGPRGP